jgi:Helix-turn-helix domain
MAWPESTLSEIFKHGQPFWVTCFGPTWPYYARPFHCAGLQVISNWTQEEAARHCGVTQPRINDLTRGRVLDFSLDALVDIATARGCRVRVDLEAA